MYTCTHTHICVQHTRVVCIIKHSHTTPVTQASRQHPTWSPRCPDPASQIWWNDADDYQGRASQDGINDAVGNQSHLADFNRKGWGTDEPTDFPVCPNGFNVWSLHFQSFTWVGFSWSCSACFPISQIPVAPRLSNIFPQRWGADELAGGVKNPGPHCCTMTCADSKDAGYVKYNSFLQKKISDLFIY